MSTYLELFHLAKSYGPAVIVEDFNLRMRRGEFVALIGHSGCGKSTVLSMIAGLTPPSGGNIVLSGKQVYEAGPDRGVVFQSPCLLPWLTALENVRLGVDQVYYTATAAERRELAEYYLSLVGLADSLHKRPAELSQGMRQRVGLARAFALSPKMLLLDEPFGMLDSLTRAELQDVLLEMWQRLKITALIITHDVDEALFLADRVVCMTDGPRATIGEVLEVPFARPRVRTDLLEDPAYYQCREHLISFLEERSHLRPLPATDDPPFPGTPLPETTIVSRGPLTRFQQSFAGWRGRAVGARE
ncbi:MAG: ABC transporter ATP-binding protein [Opitutae bacterium]|nr:ABC transporter ATP-binding protein [Opitutae bacterium]